MQMDNQGSARHVLLHSSSNVHRKKRLYQHTKTNNCSQFDGPSAKVPLFKTLSNTHTHFNSKSVNLTTIKEPTHAAENGHHEISPLTVQRLLVLSRSPPIGPLCQRSPLSTLPCSLCPDGPKPRLVAKPFTALESVRIFRVNSNKLPNPSSMTQDEDDQYRKSSSVFG